MEPSHEINPSASDMQSETESAHEHCLNCIKLNCMNEQSCTLIYCQAGCGARFHLCKEEDHRLVCMKEKVPCINRSYGCPREMSRENISKHLSFCPASVIPCMYEWNRRRMHSQEGGWKAPMPFKNPHVRCGQFDVAFALRDQKNLMDSLQLPRKTRRILRNPITSHYPKVPIQSHSSMMDSLTSESSQLSDDDTGTPWDLNQSPPGLQRTITNQQAAGEPPRTTENNLYEASRKATESLNKALDYVTGKAGLKRLSEIAKKHEEAQAQLGDKAEEINSELSNCKLSEPSSSCDNIHGHVSNSLNEEEDEFDIYCQEKQLYQVLGLDLTMHYRHYPNPAEMFTFMCGQEFRRDEYAWHVQNIHSDIQANLDHWSEQRCPLSYAGCTFSFQRLKPKMPAGSIIHSPALQCLGFTVEDEFEAVDNRASGNLTDEEDVRTTVGRSRLREATPEIHTSYKCDSTIKVIPRYKSVSREASPVKHLQYQDDSAQFHSLTELPFKVLQNIARRLDSFSIQHLSMTCHLLQSVACSLLDECGIVSLVWQKRGGDKEKEATESDAPMWQVAYKRWRFSVGTEPVLQWEFRPESHGALAEHLKVCPYNQAVDQNVKTEPFQIISDCSVEECLMNKIFLRKKGDGVLVQPDPSAASMQLNSLTD